MASACTKEAVRPVFIALQLVAPLVLLNTPVKVPAYRVVGLLGSIASVYTSPLVRPVFMALQFVPPLVLLNTPPPAVPDAANH